MKRKINRKEENGKYIKKERKINEVNEKNKKKESNKDRKK